MSLTAYGVPGSLDVIHWSELMDDVAEPRVTEGLAVTVATGTRLVDISAGRSIQAGSLVVSSTTAQKTLAANASGLSRIDVVVLQVDFSGTTSTAATFEVVQGIPAATPVVPAVTSTPGSIVRVPLAQVTVVNGAGQLVSGNVADVRAGSDASAALTMPSGWSVPGTSPLTVERRNDLVFLSGRFSRTAADLSAGDTGTLSGAVLIPAGFRPTRTVSAFYTSDLADGSPTYGKLIIPTDGTMTLYQHTGTLASGQTVRVIDQSWIGA